MKRFHWINILIILGGTVALVNYVPQNQANQEQKLNPEQANQEQKSNPEQANEKQTFQKQALGFFHTVNFNTPGTLHISQGEESVFTIEAEPKILSLIDASVANQELNIRLKDTSVHIKSPVNYYLKIKTLKAVNSYADSIINVDGLETKVFSISLFSGFAEAHLKLDVTKLMCKIVGAGKIDAVGVADEQELSINGIGEFDGKNLKSKLIKVNISGSGIAKLNASEDLLVKIVGSGTVGYCDKPNISKEITGNGSVLALNPEECK